MTIAQYVRLLRQQWLLVALITLAGTAGAAAYSHLQTPVYQASTQLFVSTSTEGGDISQLTQGGTFTQQRVKSYTDLLTSPRVLQPVIQQLHLTVTPEQLAHQVKASSPLDTVLIDISVEDTSPLRARDTADAIAARFPGLVSELERPTGRATSPVKVSVTRRAVEPLAPIAPKKSLNLALGLLVGLGLGVGGAVLRDTLDRSVKTSQQASDAAQTPVLGVVGDDPKVVKSPLITADGFSPRAESFRHLRTNIRFLSVDHRLRSLVVTGSVAAEGKTTTAANLAIAIAQSGERVVLIDADLRRPALADVFGLPSGVGLTSVLLGEVEVEDALQSWHQGLPLSVLTSGPVPPNPSELIGSSRMTQVIESLTAAGITVVIDSPPLLPVTDAAVLARATDGALVVTRVGSTHVEQLGAAAGVLRSAGAAVLGVVLNRVPRRAGGYADGYASGAGYHSYRPDLVDAAVSAPLDQAAGSAPAGPPRPAVGLPLARLAPSEPGASGTPAGFAPPLVPAPPTAAVLDLDLAGQNGHLVNSHASGHAGTNGHATNGYSPTGYPAEPNPANGYAANGYAANGYGTNGHATNGYATNGHGPDGEQRSSNGRHSGGYSGLDLPPGYDIVRDDTDPGDHWSHGHP